MADQPATPFKTEGDVIMHALDLFWFKGQQELAMELIGIIQDYRQDKAMMERTGEDGAL